MAVLVVGIDPGADGGLSLVDDSHKLLMVKKMPTFKLKVGKTLRDRLDPVEMLALLQFFANDIGVALFILEKTVAMHMGGGELMEHTGMIRGMLLTMGVRTERVEPSLWKRAMRAPKDKEQATARAEEIFADHGGRFRGPRGGKLDGPAEAAMMALYGHQAVLNLKR